MRDHVLHSKARDFAEDLSDLLNNTVCHGISLSGSLVWSTDAGEQTIRVAKVANGSGTDPAPIPLTLGRKRPSGYIALAYSLRPDAEGQHLMVTKSFIGVYLDADFEQILCHFDYDRDKPGYPEAHIQVCADSPVWSSWLQARGQSLRPLAKAHFPVGGRRNRTSLEDVVDFLICEKLADSRSNAEETIRDSRAGFFERQLRAAVRRNPDAALDELRRMDLI